MTAVDPQQLRDTMRLWASGVSIVTSTLDGQNTGMTVSAFNSLSLEPPMILVCMYKDTLTAQMVRDSGVLAVNILGDDQAYLSDRFSGRIPLADGEDRFDSVATSAAVTGAPILTNSLAWVDCRVQAVHDGGTHWIVVGEVVATDHRAENQAPLVYFDRAYRALTLEQQQA
jgi:flavin reductase (DIM6/NTAB) family NADH-FMN oxidoreductase RutF